MQAGDLDDELFEAVDQHNLAVRFRWIMHHQMKKGRDENMAENFSIRDVAMLALS